VGKFETLKNTFKKHKDFTACIGTDLTIKLKGDNNAIYVKY